MKSKTIMGLLLGIIVVGAIIILGISSTGLFSLSNDNEIKIGFASPLTGDASAWGLQEKAGFEYAINKINANGGIKGQKINVIYEDDKCDAQTAVNVYTKFIDFDNLKIVTGPVCSSVAKSVIPITEKNNVFYLADGASEDSVPRQGKLIARLWPSDAYESKAIAEYIAKEDNWKTSATIYYADNPAGISSKDKFENTLKENGVQVLLTEGILKSNKDYSTLITKIIDKNPDTIYIICYPEQMPDFINQLKASGYNKTIFAYSPSLVSNGVIENITNKENIYFANAKIVHQTDFWTNYPKDTNQTPDDVTALGYDSAMFLKYLLEKCNVNPECMKLETTKTVNWPSARGNFSFDQYGDLKEIPYEIKQLE